MATHSSILVWENSMDRGAWWATGHGLAKNQTSLKDWYTQVSKASQPSGEGQRLHREAPVVSACVLWDSDQKADFSYSSLMKWSQEFIFPAWIWTMPIVLRCLLSGSAGWILADPVFIGSLPSDICHRSSFYRQRCWWWWGNIQK